MNIIHATWEKRNLGIEAFEIELSHEDLNSIEQTIQILHEQNYKNCYVVIKLPVGNLKAMQRLQKEGFHYTETTYKIFKNIKNYEQPLDFIHEAKKFKTILLPKEKDIWKEYIDKITPGMFNTDRIALEPKFGSEISCTRYKNWIWDLYEQENTVLRTTLWEDQPIGFAIDKLTNKNISGIIGGVYPDYNQYNFGAFVFNSALDYYHNKNYSYIATTISSNNLTVFKIYLYLNFLLKNEQYVFTKIYL